MFPVITHFNHRPPQVPKGVKKVQEESDFFFFFLLFVFCFFTKGHLKYWRHSFQKIDLTSFIRLLQTFLSVNITEPRLIILSDKDQSTSNLSRLYVPFTKGQDSRNFGSKSFGAKDGRVNLCCHTVGQSEKSTGSPVEESMLNQSDVVGDGPSHPKRRVPRTVPHLSRCLAPVDLPRGDFRQETETTFT